MILIGDNQRFIGDISAARSSACAKSGLPATSMKGFGCMRREIGHNRVPAPPDRIMGMILVISEQIPGEYLIAHIV